MFRRPWKLVKKRFNGSLRRVCIIFAAFLFLFSSGGFQAQASQTQNLQSFGSSGFSQQDVQVKISLGMQPNPIGVGQELWISGFIEPSPPAYGDRFAGLTLSITNPDGSLDKFGPFLSESGLLYVSYVPAQVGNYTLQLDYSGQFFASRNVTYLHAQSPAITLIVQQEPMASKTWTVDDNGPADFSSIQAAINASSSGDVVYVKRGQYYEHVSIAKSIKLLGENKFETIIDGKGTGNVVTINASNAVVKGFTIQRGAPSLLSGGIYLINASQSFVSDNVFVGNSIGVYSKSSSNNFVLANNATNGEYGIYLENSSNTKISVNNAANCNIGISTNFSSRNNTISGNNVADNGSYGISIPLSSDTTISLNEIKGNQFGIDIQRSSNIIVSHNIITSSSQGGISLALSSNIVLFGNDIIDNGHGIYLYSSTNNVISANTLNNKWNGIQFTSSSNNTITANTLTGNLRGVHFMWSSNNNEVFENIIAGNSLFGIYMDTSSNNRIYHNEINNVNQVYSVNSTNTWDDGYPSGGNYWSNYNGADADGDGIGDTAYVIDSTNQDRYPLMRPFNPTSDVQTEAFVTLESNPVGVGQTVHFNIWITPPPPTLNDRFEAIILSIINPDGTRQFLGPFLSDSYGFLTAYFVPTMVGDYKIQVNYTGQFFTSFNVTYLDTQSAVATLNVLAQLTPKTWIVDDNGPADFRTIQEAINAASSGDIILVRSGTYKENPVITKPLSLLGENASQTTILAKNTWKTVTVNASKVTISGFTIQGSGAVQGFGGVSFQPNNVIISNVNQNSYGNNITGNIITGDGYGISLRGSRHYVIDNYVTSNGFAGIYLNGSSNNVITGNNVTGGKTGITIAYPSSNNILRNNTMTGDNLNFHVIGYDIPSFTNDIDTSNTVNGKPIYYWVGKANQVVPADAGAVYIINSVNITVQNLELSSNGQGILLAWTTGSTVRRNNITKCDNGIRIQSASNNLITQNNIYENRAGVALWKASYNTLTNNTIKDSEHHAVYIYFSTGNRFYHNDFNNIAQVQTDGLDNYWDNGYPSGGNYWSDYSGSDANGDGIGDTPYIIKGNVSDHYPLMKTRGTTMDPVNNTSTEGLTQEKQNTASTTAAQENSEQPESVTPEEPVEHDDGDEPATAVQDPQEPFSIAVIVIAVLFIITVEALVVAPLLLFKRKH
jgi:parallel beta-helix repeat protein